MQTVIDILLQAGRSAMEVALYNLLPILVVMMIVMRLLEVHAVGLTHTCFTPTC